jgi:hypothetical protein
VTQSVIAGFCCWCRVLKGLLDRKVSALCGSCLSKLTELFGMHVSFWQLICLVPIPAVLLGPAPDLTKY